MVIMAFECIYLVSVGERVNFKVESLCMSENGGHHP